MHAILDHHVPRVFALSISQFLCLPLKRVEYSTLPSRPSIGLPAPLPDKHETPVMVAVTVMKVNINANVFLFILRFTVDVAW
jgi:hypothetical protein